MPTIPRNHTKRVAEVKGRATRCKVYSLQNDFTGKEVDPVHAWNALEQFSFARLVENNDGTWTVQVHGNLWYDLKPAANEGEA